jgi:ATP-dependent Lon protease
MNTSQDATTRDWLIAASFGSGLNTDGTGANDLPEIVEAPVIPLRDMVIFPRAVTPLSVARDRSLRALDHARELGFAIGLSQRQAEATEPRPSDLHSIGTLLSIGRSLALPDGSASLLVQGRARVQVIEWVRATPYFIARAKVLREPSPQTNVAEALIRVTFAQFDRVVSLNSAIPEDAAVYAMNIHEPGWLADFITGMLPLNLSARQSLLEAIDPVERLQKLSALLARELDVLELEDKIHERAQNEVDKSQREYYLREQMRSIQKELGEIDAGASELGSLRDRLKRKTLPNIVRERADREVAKLEQLPGMAPEVGIVRDYIEWILDLPWNETTDDRLDVRNAAKILDERHFGLTKAKERILEHIAVRKLTNGARSPILCFAGPPGTGKTSLARSIADSLGRKFVRVSVGGVHDEAEIRGHRRTYIGALPGRILQTMRRAGTVNPLFVLDEIDKLGDDFRGDPSAALLEVLDPEQNTEFEDHYLDLPYDLSRVMWVTTANSVYDIPPALRDRLEIIEFSGYSEEEKVEIARRFLLPKQLNDNGLTQTPIAIGDDVVQNIIRQYTYEAGVRSLDRELARICRKTAHRVAEGKAYSKRVTSAVLSKYLGPPQFDPARMEATDQIGMANGVSWSEAGGDLLPIEVTLMDGDGGLTLTGSLGDVMQESAKAALSYARARATDLGIAKRAFEKNDLHIHVAEGAIPKDGPSAGITMATALISALTKIAVRRDVAMTGEITLRGRVLPIGGLKEKLMAAHRAGIRTLIMPRKNAKDLEEVPRKVLKEMSIHQAELMDEVLAHALVRKPAPAPVAASRKAKAKSRKPVAARPKTRRPGAAGRR